MNYKSILIDQSKLSQINLLITKEDINFITNNI